MMKIWMKVLIPVWFLLAVPEVVPAFPGAAAQEEVLPELPVDDGFSIPGNAEIVDNPPDNEAREFFTIRTLNGSTFFLILDRAASGENVYLLSMVDEQDLGDFTDQEEEKKEEEMPKVFFPEFTPTPFPEASPSPSPAPAGEGKALPLGMALAAGAGVFCGTRLSRAGRAKKERGENLEIDDRSYGREDPGDES